MPLGLALIFGATICGLIVACGGFWLIRTLRTGEFGVSGPGLAPSIRRVRQPVKFWLAVAVLGGFLVFPLAVVLFVVSQVFA
ncbi:hypothetical protein GGQ87_002615 [Brevundimonas alba]|uniref:Uncharacterized protein n=1 Tax=Brevundimonas alba TaxID=74314 RepID=A0A7X6BQ00_9CAUL|nr:hypothetical protein [Brevundimonas alba]NJC42320.1 hypothetical protein [Brevundimonas alba]